MLQEPGPRGSPHDPQALIGRSHPPADLAGVLDCAAKTDINAVLQDSSIRGGGRRDLAHITERAHAALAEGDCVGLFPEGTTTEGDKLLKFHGALFESAPLQLFPVTTPNRADLLSIYRRLIASAIGPIWEANHVWLIIVVVLLFTCFPPAISAGNRHKMQNLQRRPKFRILSLTPLFAKRGGG